MNKEAIEKYSSEIPEEIRCLIEPLNSEENWALFVYVLENGDENELHLSDIEKEFVYERAEVLKKIRPLIASGLISQHSRPCDIGDYDRALYSPTTLGKLLVEGLMDKFYP